jgi:hypothetical protein
MLSYRENLTKMGITSSASVSYRDFHSTPKCLRQAILSMQAPPSQGWSQVSDIFRDDFWTDEVQGATEKRFRLEGNIHLQRPIAIEKCAMP